MTLKTSLIITGDASVAQKAVDELNASVATLAAGAKSAAAPIGEVDKAQAGAAASARDASSAATQLGAAQKEAAGGSRGLAQSTDAAKVAQTGGATAAREAAAAQQGYSQALAKTAADSGKLVAANENVASSTTAAGQQLAAIEAAQTAAAGGATAHAAAAAGLESEIQSMVAQIASGATVFEAMATRGGAFAAALGEVAQASESAKTGIAAAGNTGKKAGVDLGDLGDAALDVTGKATSMGGALGSVTSILGGPWGAALGIAVNLLGGFATGLLDSKDAADDAAEGASNLARYVGDLGNFFDATTGKILQTNAAIRENAALAAHQRGQAAAARIADAKERGGALIRESTRSQIEGGGTYTPGGSYTGQLSRGNRDIAEIFASGKDVDAQLRKLATGKSGNANSAAEILRLRGEIAQARGDIAQAKKDVADVERGYRAPAPSATRPTPPPTGGSVAAARSAGAGRTGVRHTAADAAADAAAESQRQLARDLEQITSRYLPATAAAKDYGDELARIDALAASYDGKNATSGLSAEQATAARAALKAANDARVKEINLTPEARAADDAKKSIDGVIASLQQELAVRQTLDPVQRAMAEHQGELAAMSDAERVAREALLRSQYEQREAYTAVEEATRAAADAQRQFRDMALDAFDAVAIGGENAGKVIERLAKTIASAAIEAAVLGTGPLAALLKGGTAAPAAAAASAGQAQATADILSRSVSKSLGDRLDSVFGKGNGGKALQGAGFGYTAASILGGSGIGGALGGALGERGGELLQKGITAVFGKTLGSFAGPFGAIAGGVLGGVVGKLFAGTKTGSATIGAVNGQAAITGTGGNNAAYTKAASGLAGTVNDSIEAIIARLGGTLGSYAVSIGQRNKKFVVDESGRGSTKYGKANDGITAYETAEEAAAAALLDAVKDGAVSGLSAAVAKAIKSSTDVNKALAEAMKVQELELLVGGVNAQIDKAFRDFETQAKERVRLATTYGFDVVAIEKRNGEDRVKLAQQLAAQQVGSLQKLIEEITQGSLFEGTAIDRIAVLNTAITKAKSDLAAGIEGAGDTLADLYQKRLAATKDAYGTTSAYAANRTATLDEARAAVAAANARIVAAQPGKSASDPALATTNKALDENNDQNAKLIALTEQNGALLARLGAGRAAGSAFNLAKLASI